MNEMMIAQAADAILNGTWDELPEEITNWILADQENIEDVVDVVEIMLEYH